MAKITITRRQIIKALQTEPLRPGHYAKESTNKGCTVCAVGGVMRQIFKVDLKTSVGLLDNLCSFAVDADRNGDIHTSMLSATDDPDESLAAGAYLTALSAQFETLCTTRNVVDPETYEFNARKIPAVRKLLIAWVKENLPASFEADIGGYQLPKKTRKK